MQETWITKEVKTMVIQGDFFRLTPSGEHSLLFDLELLHTVKGKNTREEYKIAGYGINMRLIVVENELQKNNVVPALIANISRKIALAIVSANNLDELGNRKVSAIYKTLMETSAQMQELYASLMRQELSKRVEDLGDAEFLAALEKLKVTKVTPQELFREFGNEILSVCPIIITTPTAAVNYIYDTGVDHFDTLIVDEASQMPIIAILPYLDRIKQLVVFGDHMQLGITSIFMKKDVINASEVINDTAYIDKSVLQAVQGRLPNFNLTYHYRSQTEMLIHVSNKTCYDGMLQVVPDVFVAREALPNYLGLELIRIHDPEQSKKGGNISEAFEIISRVEKLREDMPEKSIGIITFNEIQQDLICDMIDEMLGGYDDDQNLWVRSLENAQGKEADFIFVSIGHCRRNQDGSLHKGISEINRVGGENRLNVLFTRARCKNFITISFDYHELKKSENPGIQRLYAYLEYAATGKLNETSSSRTTNADHYMTKCVSETLSSSCTGYHATYRIGTANMAVDIALKQDKAERYSIGLLMPAFRQTSQETITKITVLEKTGWLINPISPIYFLTNPELVSSQLKRFLDNPVLYSIDTEIGYDTNQEPDVPFDLSALGGRVEEGIEAQLSSITEDDFLSMNFERVYREVLSEFLFDLSSKELNELTKEGNTEANLLLLIRLSGKFIAEGKRRALLSNVNRLYITQKEKRAGYLFAQLLRIGEIGDNKKLIRKLLDEAYKLGIGGLDDA